jgi:hypothetical protein
MTANPSSENQIAAASTQDVRGSGLSVASGSALSDYFFVKVSENSIPFKVFADNWSVDSGGLRFWRGEKGGREDVAWFTNWEWFQRGDANKPNGASETAAPKTKT